MTLNKVGALILFSGLALTALQIRSCQSNRAWETKAKAAVAKVDSVLAIAARERARSDSIIRVAQAKDSAATKAAKWAFRSRKVADSLARAYPDSLTVPKAAYEALGQAFDTLQGAYQVQVEATAGLRLALGIERGRGDSLVSALESVTRVLRDRPHPSGPCGLGVGAGWGIHGPDAVIGVTCKISLALPRLHL